MSVAVANNRDDSKRLVFAKVVLCLKFRHLWSHLSKGHSGLLVYSDPGWQALKCAAMLFFEKRGLRLTTFTSKPSLLTQFLIVP